MMPRYSLWVIIPLLVGTATYMSQVIDWRRQLSSFTDSHPILDCPQVIEFGERELGEVALARFTVANRGGTELVIDEVQSNCACSGLEREQNGKLIRVERLRLKPRESMQLIMRLLVQGTPGSSVTNGVQFHTSDPANPDQWIEASVSRVRAGAATRPTSVVFGSLSAGSTVQQVMDVFDSAIQRRAINRVVSLNPDRATVRLIPTEGNTSALTKDTLGELIGRIEVTACTDQPGSLDTEIEIYLTGDRRPPTAVPVTGRVTGPVEVSPSLLVLPRASEAGPVYSAKCRFRNNEGKTVIVSVGKLPEGLSAQIEDNNGSASERIVEIEWDPQAKLQIGPPVQHKLQFRALVDGKESTLIVPILCLGKRNS